MIQTDYGREGVHSEHFYARGPSRTSSGNHPCLSCIQASLFKKYGYRSPYTSSVSNYDRYLHSLLREIGEEFNDTVIRAPEAIGYLIALPRTTINMGWYRDEE